MGFLNVDLEIRSREKLDAIVDALGDRVLTLHHARRGGASFLVMETHESGPETKPGPAFRRWLTVIATLRGEARRGFRAARVVASAGFDAGDAHATSVMIDAEHVRAFGRLGIAIEVVVYRPEEVVTPKRRRAR